MLMQPPMNYIFAFFLTCSMLAGFSCSKQYPDALTPEKSLESFQVQDGFKVEIFATEPHVKDPVSMLFDEEGNVFVVEMPDYPYKPEPGQGKGRIKLLKDSDGDGRIDQSTVFAENLSEATSILPWKGGLLVTAAPHILYMKDTNHDARADTQETLFSGFFENNSEAQITNLTFSIDNWIYAANHGQAGEVTFSRKPDAPSLAMGGADFRFRLDKDAFEQTTGPAQFGLAINEWGHRFITQNTIHIRHAVMPWRYMHRHPYLPSTTGALNISDHDLRMFQRTPPPYWRAERTRRRQQRYDEQNLDRVEYAEDHFTGASGGTVYAGDAFPKAYHGNIFTGDVAGNLVHRDVITPLDDSPTYVAQRDDNELDKEFLAAADPWFRPANFTVGPDGYLYVIDMYRQHIETPLSIPEDLKEDMDFYNGSEMGRIYRIVPENAENRGNIRPNLRDEPAEALVALLAHPNQWWRLQAQRLLLEKQDKSVVAAVRTMFMQHESPKARLHALYVLEGLDALNAEIAKQAMKDAHPGVREHGVMLSEQFPECIPQLMAGIDDPSVRVAFQASLSAGAFDNEQAINTLAKALGQYGENVWFRTAVLSAEAGTTIDLLKELETQTFFQETAPWKLTFLEDFCNVTGRRNQPGEITLLITTLTSPSLAVSADWQKAGVKGMSEGLQQSAAEDPALTALLKDINTDSKEGIKNALAAMQEFYTQPM